MQKFTIVFKRCTLFFAVSALLLSCSYRPHAVTGDASRDDSLQATQKAWVADNGWHTSIIVRAAGLDSLIPGLKKHLGEFDYYELGWGDEEFYRARQTTFWMKAKAVLWPTSAVMHVVGIEKNPMTFFPANAIVELELTTNEHQRLLRFLADSFQIADSGIADLGKGLYGRSRFFRATGDYYACNTCNTWTAKGLASAGYDIWPLFNPTAGGVMDNLKNE